MKIFVASFNRASDGAISKLVSKLEQNDMLTLTPSDSDYILACGDRRETFEFSYEWWQKGKKIIHLWSGEVNLNWATKDEIYRHSLTLMSMMQLCTNEAALERVMELCKVTGKISNVYIAGNVMLDNLDDIDESLVPKEYYDLVLYNPPTNVNKEGIEEDIKNIQNLIKYNKCLWIEANGDEGSEIINQYSNLKNLSRPKFLGLLKNCRRFIGNSSSRYYEAPFFLKPNQIIQIGKRNSRRESKDANMKIEGASDKIIRIFKEELK